MPKRKRPTAKYNHSFTQTFSLMEENADLLEGLVMHKEAISEEFENQLISFVQTQVRNVSIHEVELDITRNNLFANQCEKGRRGEIKKPTYLRAAGARSQGNKRESLMYGGFFDFNRARPGKRGIVPPFPPILERLVDHLIACNYLPADTRPDSCIINQYDKGDCIPPHVDHASYYRPISTLSLLGEEPMLVGSKFRTVRSCTWAPTIGQAIPLPRRSLLVLGGNSGNIAKHCISACKGKRISITLRKQPDPDWEPDGSELAGKKSKLVEQSNPLGNNIHASNETDRPKKKSISGAAKRRKKMMKQKSQTRFDVANTSKESTNEDSTDNNLLTSQIVRGKRKATQLKVPGAKKKDNDKQARRNARRLLKKNTKSKPDGEVK